MNQSLCRLSGVTALLSALTFGANEMAAAAEPAALRVKCEGASANAEVRINGVLKGECPLDMEMPPGRVLLRATKKIDAVSESVFRQEFTVGAGVLKSIDVVFFPMPGFRAEAVKRMDAEIEPGLVAAELKRRNEIPELENRAAKGDGAAMGRLGLFYKFGLAGPVDTKKAVLWYKKGAEAGDPESMFHYAEMLELGKYGVPEDEAAAFQLYIKSAEQGVGDAMAALGRYLKNGKAGVPKDLKQANILFKGAAQRGSAYAHANYLYTLPEAERQAGLEVQKQLKAVEKEIQIRQAELGEKPDAFILAAHAYQYGSDGISENRELALRYFRMAFRQQMKAAAAGDAEAMYTLGSMTGYGHGMPADNAEAIRYYQKAKKMGSKNAADELRRLEL